MPLLCEAHSWGFKWERHPLHLLLPPQPMTGFSVVSVVAQPHQQIHSGEAKILLLIHTQLSAEVPTKP